MNRSASDPRSLGELLSDLPENMRTLISAELNQVKADTAHKGKFFGIGSGLFAGAAVVLVFFLFTLVVAGVFAFALIMPGWAAALAVAGILLVLTLVLVLFGVVAFKRGKEPIAAATSIRRDIHAVKGIGDYAKNKDGV